MTKLYVDLERGVTREGRYDAGIGFDPSDPPPLYRTWGTARGGVLVRLYLDEGGSA